MDIEQAPKKVLLFVTNLPENLKIVLSFLGKRDFDVYIETEIKDAVVQVFEKKPDFIFIAWDHSDRKIMRLPELLEKSTASIIVPFINKNTKDSILRFGQCPISPKLYPPVSGPAIERLILKHSKEDSEFIAKVNQFKSAVPTEEDVISIQNNLSSMNAPIEDTEPPPAPEEVSLEKSNKPLTAADFELPEELEQLTQELEKRNLVLDQEKHELNEEQIESIKTSLAEEVVDPLTNILQSIEEQDSTADQDSLSSSPPPEIKTDLIIEKSGAQFTRQNPLVFKDENSDSFVEHTPTELHTTENHTNLFQVYCFSIVAENWCGYFVVSTQAKMDYPSLDLAFTEWLKKQFPNLGTISERDFFEFDQVDAAAIEEIQKMAELSEKIKVHNYDFRISFFSVKPDDMKVEFNNERSYIKIFTRDIPTDDPIGFNLFLHLPENRKYLLYSQKNKPLNDDQKNRLLSKNVTELYTKISDEHTYRKFLLRKTFTRLYQLINNKLSVL